MLFKKTLKVASATALWMVALLGANSAMAQEETIYSAETLDGSGPTYGVQVESDLTTDALLNSRAVYYINNSSESDPVYIRVSGSGVLRFVGPPAVALVHQTGATVTARTALAAIGDADREEVDGAPNSGWIYEIDTPPTIPDTDRLVAVRVTIAELGNTDAATPDVRVTGLGEAGVTVAVYDKKVDAHFGEGTPYVTATAEFFTVARSVRVASATGSPATPVTNWASAISRFTAIRHHETATAPYEVNLGGFNITVRPSHKDASTGLAVGGASSTPEMRWTAVGLRRSQTAVNGTTRFQSPGGWDFADGFRLAGNAPATATGNAICAQGKGPDLSDAGPVEGDGAGIMSSPLSEKNATDDVIGGIKEAAWYLCATVSNDNDVEIPAGFYLMDVNLTQPLGSTRAFPPRGAAGIAVGRIRHDGTTVRIPFVTSYDGYTQRIVIVNRNKVDVGYSIAFHVEGDGDLEGDNPHRGTAMADQATVVRVADIVTLTDPTRAAATLTVAAQPATIDVATTMVNKMDQSTDTVVLMAEDN